MTGTTLKKALEAAEHPILLKSAAQLDEAAAAWRDAPVLGVDTEFVRERTYRANLGLVQVSDAKTAWLFDPLALDPRGVLADMLHDPGNVKLLHSGSEDLEVLLHAAGAQPQPLVDTQIACALLGQPLQLGYHAAVRWLFDVEIAKDLTRSNWCRRPLRRPELRYAALDVVLLPLMLEQLRPRLEQAGRWEWLEEEMRRLQQNAGRIVEPEAMYLRVSGVGRLDQAGLRVLRALATWRERTAQEKNRARGFVVPDAALMKLAQQNPASIDALREIGELHPTVISRYGETLLGLIGKARKESGPVERPEALTNAQRRQLALMRKAVQAAATRLGVEPALLASRRELENLIRSAGKGGPVPERFLGWRKGVIGDELLSIIG